MKLAYRTFLAWIAGIFGITSCGEQPTGIICMYGMPPSDFDVTLKVTDEDGKPIPGIEASAYDLVGKAYTDKSGTVKMEVKGTSALIVTLTDVDGADNGGEFEELRVEQSDFEVKLIKVYDDKRNWYNGEFEATASVKMNRKASE